MSAADESICEKGLTSLNRKAKTSVSDSNGFTLSNIQNPLLISLQQSTFESIVVKGEIIAHNEQILPLILCIQLQLKDCSFLYRDIQQTCLLQKQCIWERFDVLKHNPY